MKLSPGGRTAVIGLVYFVLHVGLDAAARLFEVAPGVSLWYPPAGLAVALTTMFGLRFAPAVLVAQLWSALVTSSSPSSWSQLALPVLITVVYAGAGGLVRRFYGPMPAPTRPLRTAGLIAIGLAAPTCAALAGTAIVIFSQHLPPEQFVSIAFGWWIGDLTGLLTIVPLCLVHLGPLLVGDRRPALRSRRSARERLELMLQAAVLVLCLALVRGFGYIHAYQAYYLCFIPLVWICLRHGLAGATLTIFTLTLGGLLSLKLAGASAQVVMDLIIFEVAVAIIGLGLGATVTRRTRAENDRSRLLAILEATPDLVATSELDGHVLFQNAALLRLRGPRTVPAASRLTLSDFHPPWAADKILHEGIPAALAHGTWQAETAFLDARGREVPVSQLLVAHYDEKRQPVLLSIVARDITDQKVAERDRLETERNLLQAQKLESLGVLAGGIAHDFNNLLTVMLGNATLARLDLTPHSPAENAVHQIELAALRAAELCRQMLAYSGKGRFATELVDLSRLVDETTHLLKVSISKKCTLEFALAPDLPPVKGDATQLSQISMNLVMNASDASAEQGGRITVRTGLMHADRAFLASTYLSPSLRPGPYVFLEVSDEGCGMTPEVVSRIFEPFFTTKFSGHGLGLSAVLGIARSHHGTIKIDTAPGRGTTFRLLLPAAIGALSPPEIHAPAATTSRGAGRVLVVDDEEAVREIAARILTRHGYIPIPAIHGQQGVEIFRADPTGFRAVLLDLTMPVMDGEEAFKELHALNPAMPVVLMSGYSKTASAERFAGRGVAGFLQKPFDSAGLIAALHAVLDESARAVS